MRPERVPEDVLLWDTEGEGVGVGGNEGRGAGQEASRDHVSKSRECGAPDAAKTIAASPTA